MRINNEDIQMTVIRSARKTFSIEIRMDGILVKAPRHMRMREIQEVIEWKREWIERSIEKIQKRKEVLKQVEPYTEDEMKDMMEKARMVLPKKVEHYAALVGVCYGRITIRKQRTRWGSCSGKGNLSFTWRWNESSQHTAAVRNG